MRHVDAARCESIHLLQTDLGIKGDPVRDDIMRPLVENARRQQAQLVLLTCGDDRVSRVAAALIANDGICLLREIVDDLSLSLVAPLRTCDNDG